MASPRVLLVASTTGYQTQMFAEAAARIGFVLQLATDRCHVLEDPWGDRAIPIRFESPEVERGLAVDGIVALGDRPAEAAASLAASLGLPFHPVDAVAACRNKFLARQRFQSAGLPVPAFYRVAIQEGWQQAMGLASFPCVLKPLNLSASRGVIRANNPTEFRSSFERIAAIVGPSESLQVEAFIPGREFALEGLVTGGRLRVLALFDKPDPLDGPFFEETIYVTPSREPETVQQAIVAAAQQAVSALGLTHGPIHAEMRVNAEGVWMLELAGRPIGGLCSRVLPGLEELILRHAVGQEISWEGPGASGVMMIPVPGAGILQSVSGIEEAKAVPGIEDVVISAKIGEKLIPLPEGNSYPGFLFARGGDSTQVVEALRKSFDRLRFVLTAALPVLPS